MEKKVWVIVGVLVAAGAVVLVYFLLKKGRTAPEAEKEPAKDAIDSQWYESIKQYVDDNLDESYDWFFQTAIKRYFPGGTRVSWVKPSGNNKIVSKTDRLVAAFNELDHQWSQDKEKYKQWGAIRETAYKMFNQYQAEAFNNSI